MSPDVDPSSWEKRAVWTPRSAGVVASCRPQRDPGSGEVICEVAEAAPEEVKTWVTRVAEGYWDSGLWPLAQRREWLARLADFVEASAESLGRLDSRCTGKLLSEGVRTARSGATLLRYFAGILDEGVFHRALNSVGPSVSQWVDRLPVGVIACILPWNYPVSQACARVAMLLASGNAVILKGSELAQPPLVALAELAEQARIPEFALSVVTGGPGAGATLVGHPDVDGICFTGGVPTGIRVAAESSVSLKRTVLELGGKTPDIVLVDADLGSAVEGLIAASFRNQGQVCSAAANIFVERPRYEEFVDALAKRTERLKVGYQLAPDTDLGPVISEEAKVRIETMIQDAISSGATVLARSGGGSDLPRRGYYVPATLLADVPSTCRLASEETFGPVTVVAPFDDLEEVVHGVNASEYGLAAGVWGGYDGRATHLAQQLRAGVIWLNCHGPIPPNAPWGGFRLSGLGRLYGLDGLLAFTEARATYELTAGVSKQ